MTLGEMMHLPWGWEGPMEVREPNEEAHFELRVKELCDFFVAGRTPEEALANCAAALRAFLQSYLDAGEEPPLPATREPSWIVQRQAVHAPKTLPKVRTPTEQILTA